MASPQEGLFPINMDFGFENPKGMGTIYCMALKS
jgi:hypothetical protein